MRSPRLDGRYFSTHGHDSVARLRDEMPSKLGASSAAAGFISTSSDILLAACCKVSDVDDGAATSASARPSLPQEADVSALMKASIGLVQWSPCGTLLAAAHGSRVTVRDARSLQIVQQFAALDAVAAVTWSADAQLVAAAMYKRAVVQIWSVKDTSWTCRISEGIAGLVYGIWAPDSRHFITVADFQLHATVWSLVDSAKYVIRSPKLAAKGFAFSPDGELLAVAERHDCKDFIGIYNCASWELAAHFPLESYDCAEIVWSPDNSTIAVRDNHIEFRVLLYAANGTLLAKYQFLALGSYDDHVRVLSHLNWQPIADFDHVTTAVTVSRVNKSAIEFEEHFADGPVSERPRGKRFAISQQNASLVSNSSLAASAAAEAAGGRRTRDICFVVHEPPFSVLTTNPDPLKDNPKMGISRVAWSSDSAFIATKSDQMPHNVWIWATETMTLHSVVSLIQPVRNVRWDPVHCRLAMCSGENRVYLWSTHGVSWIDVPADDFKAIGLRWSSTGDALVAIGRQDFCCVTL
ncbi:hypothetical protein PybrP1_006690 [[Pythium] brassicae (nom. inval.)]|nr:hypothetical protein PybrP1_006690 [[Pythium] brassicae (nom. inval.)]